MEARRGQVPHIREWSLAGTTGASLFLRVLFYECFSEQPAASAVAICYMWLVAGNTRDTTRDPGSLSTIPDRLESNQTQSSSSVLSLPFVPVVRSALARRTSYKQVSRAPPLASASGVSHRRRKKKGRGSGNGKAPQGRSHVI